LWYYLKQKQNASWKISWVSFDCASYLYCIITCVGTRRLFTPGNFSRGVVKSDPILI
jgi:hypothetical protein